MKRYALPYLIVAAAAVGCAFVAPAPTDDWATLDLPLPAAEASFVEEGDALSAEPAVVPVVQRTPDLRPVQGFSLQRYLGTWHEIARLPSGYEQDCASAVTAQYLAADDERVSVLNRCTTAQKQVVQAAGVATQPEPGVGRLRVSFLPRGLTWLPFSRAEYWVLDIDADYRHVLVGTPDRRALWILSRDASVPQETFERLLTRARELGFPTGQLMLTMQEPGVQELPVLMVMR